MHHNSTNENVTAVLSAREAIARTGFSAKDVTQLQVIQISCQKSVRGVILGVLEHQFSIKENWKRKRIYFDMCLCHVHFSQQKLKRTCRDTVYIKILHMAITGFAEYLKTRQQIECAFKTGYRSAKHILKAGRRRPGGRPGCNLVAVQISNQLPASDTRPNLNDIYTRRHQAAPRWQRPPARRRR